MAWKPQGLPAGIYSSLETRPIVGGGPITDWIAFYTTGTLVRQGLDSSIYDPAVQSEAQSILVSNNSEPLAFVNPPAVAWALSPFALLSFAQSYFLWFAVNTVVLAVLAFSGWRATAAWETKQRIAFLGLAAASFPVASTLLNAQLDLWVAGSITGCYWCIRAERPLLAGIILAASLAKPHFALATLVLLMRHRQWRALVGFAVASLPILVAPVLAAGAGTLLDAARLAGSYLNATSEYGAGAAMMVNVRGALTSLWGTSSVWLWAPPSAAVTIIAAWRTARVWSLTPIGAPQSWALAFVAPLVYAPHVHYHSMVLLLPALALWLEANARCGKKVPAEYLMGGSSPQPGSGS